MKPFLSIRKIFIAICIVSAVLYVRLLWWYSYAHQTIEPEPQTPPSAMLAFTEESRQSLAATEEEPQPFWVGLDISTEPKSFPWHKWGSSSHDGRGAFNGTGVDFAPLLEALVLLDQSPPEEYQFDILVIRNGTLYRPQAKVDANHDRPAELVRFSVMQRSIQEALDHTKEYLHTQPRFRKAFYDNELVFLVWKGDDTFCADKDWILYDRRILYFPTFQWCREVTCDYSWPIPNFHILDVFWHMHSAEWENVFAQQREQYPWQNKTRKAFWRGTVTGVMEDWQVNNTRVQMARIANQHSDIMDVAFVGNDQIPQQDKAEFDEEFQLVEMMERVDQQRFVAIIDIDGNSWSSRLSNQLCLNAVTIKVKAHWEDYFYSELEPWAHYVPVHGNLSNLVGIVRHVLDEKNKDQMQTIIQNANNWCKSKLTRMQMSIDLLWMLVAFSEALDRGDASWREKWKSNITAYTLPHLNMTQVDPNMTIPR